MSFRIIRPDTAYTRVPKPDVPQKEPAFLAFLRQQPCLVLGCRTDDVIAHHVKLERGADGKLKSHNQLGKRPPDSQCVPLSDWLHQHAPDALHKGNEAAWWEWRQIDPLVAAAAYYALYENGVRGTLPIEESTKIWRLAAAK